MLGALARGETRLRGLLQAEDVASTAQCLREMGVPIWPAGEEIVIEGQGDTGLSQPLRILDAGNSGTTLRLLLGIISSFPIQAEFDGDASLRRRPMDRVAVPLRQMGAEISGEGRRCRPPVKVQGGELQGIEYHLPMASAQVKSAILLAGLRASGETTVHEPGPTRDHTERMLRAFGAKVASGAGFARLAGGQDLKGHNLTVPGDISAAAFAIVAGALLADAEIEFFDLGLNPTRTGLLEVLSQMGADLAIEPDPLQGSTEAEPLGRLRVRGGKKLQGCEISGTMIPRLIDELPVICVAAACGEGKTVIRGAEELRVKESDRITATADMLTAFGAEVEELPDGLIVHGGRPFRAARIDSGGDHRIAMAAAVAGMIGEGGEVTGAEAIATSYPGFAEDLTRLGARLEIEKE